MDDSEAADAAVAEIQAFAAQTLRRHLPFLTSPMLADVVSKGTRSFQDGLNSSKPAMAASRSRISFMSLSAELRNRIYELELEPRTRLILGPTDSRRLYGGYRYKPAPPAITKVSRQIRAETLPMYYGNTTFEIFIDDAPGKSSNDTIMHEVPRFLDIIGTKAAGMIKHFHIRARRPVFRAADGVRSKKDFRDMCIQKLGLVQAGITDSACTIEFLYRQIWDRDDGSRDFFKEDGRFVYSIPANEWVEHD